MTRDDLIQEIKGAVIGFSENNLTNVIASITLPSEKKRKYKLIPVEENNIENEDLLPKTELGELLEEWKEFDNPSDISVDFTERVTKALKNLKPLNK